MKLVVGLGNPGRKYTQTRHNVGFAILDELAGRHATNPARTQFQGLTQDLRWESGQVLLLWPQTYMNRSGESVSQAMRFFKLAVEDVLIVCDDFHLPLAKLRIRGQGSSGGQRGLEDIVHHLGTQQFARLRVGVGPVPAGQQGAAFVLGRFTPDEATQLAPTLQRAADAIECWIREGTAAAMNQYNGWDPTAQESTEQEET